MGPIVGGPQLNPIGYVGKGDTRPQSLSSGFDYTVKPHLLTDFRFGWYRQRIFVNPLATGSFAQDAGAPGLEFHERSHDAEHAAFRNWRRPDTGRI